MSALDIDFFDIEVLRLPTCIIFLILIDPLVWMGNKWNR